MGRRSSARKVKNRMAAENARIPIEASDFVPADAQIIERMSVAKTHISSGQRRSNQSFPRCSAVDIACAPMMSIKAVWSIQRIPAVRALVRSCSILASDGDAKRHMRADTAP